MAENTVFTPKILSASFSTNSITLGDSVVLSAVVLDIMGGEQSDIKMAGGEWYSGEV